MSYGKDVLENIKKTNWDPFTKEELSRIPTGPKGDKPRILMFAGDLAGCAHYRLLTPSWGFLSKNKYEVRNSMVVNKDKYLWNPDVVVWARQHSSDVMMHMEEFKRRGATIIYETDDNLFQLDPSHPGFKEVSKLKKDLKKAVKICDKVTVSTEPLREVYSKIHNNVIVLPNQILRTYANFYVPNKTDTIRIGWAGTNTHIHDFGGALEALIEVAKRNEKVKLVFFGYMPPEINNLPSNRYEFHPFVDTSIYHATLGKLRLDFGVAPLKDNAFNKSKSNIKVLEYGVLGLPTVASPVYPYEKTINSEKDGIVVKKNRFKEWVKSLEYLVNNKEERIKMGTLMQHKVLENYEIEKNIYRWEEAYFS